MGKSLVNFIVSVMVTILVSLNIVVATEPIWVKKSDSLDVTCMIEYNSTVIFGTTSGLYYLDGENAIRYETIPSQPVFDIIKGHETELFVSIQSAVYQGAIEFSEAPYYEFTELYKSKKPQALGYHDDTLMISRSNAIFISIRERGYFSTFEGLYVRPKFPFGDASAIAQRQTYCCDIHYSTRLNGFLAGGYSEGYNGIALFILLTAEFFCTTTLERLNTVSIEEVSCEDGLPSIYFGGQSALYKLNATQSDTPTYSKERIASPNLRMNDITSFTVESSDGPQSTVVVATSGGVYSMVDGDGALVEVQNLGRSARAVAFVSDETNTQRNISGGKLFAGTENGIYLLEDPTNISKKSYSTNSLNPTFAITAMTLEINLNRENSGVSNIKFFDMAGKLVYKTSSNKNSISINLEKAGIVNNLCVVVIESDDFKYSHKIMRIK